ncbi:lipopolysaccharide biosynthesis protein [Porphyromonas macacae]|uniref:Sugar transporter n=1 Tax=Porphyromonas macacae TaxID=28115 RepID=A0A379DHX2_9PORP|nr:sugar transporter [Porphyromonas macacae]SUB77988.1 Uncharacterised protein [Porphyromonas macacae]
MEQESRVKKSLLNARVNLFFYFITLVLSFFSRKIFLDCLGVSFVGLITTLQNLLGFLNLAELGIGTAIGYTLYKPLYQNNKYQISEVVSVLGYLYRRIGIVILGGGILLSLFLPLIFLSTDFSQRLIFFAFYTFLISSLISYFLNYKQLLLGADQKSYVITAYFQSAIIVKTILQMTSAYYTRNYYLWVTIEFIFGFIFSWILNWKIHQVYPWLQSNIKQGKLLLKKHPEIWKYTKQLFVHQINEFIQFQTAPLFIYSFVSLKTVAYYGNYLLISDKLTQVLEHILGSTRASIGNLIAEGNIRRVENIFWELNTIEFFVAGFFSFGLLKYTEPFVSLWLGPEYIMAISILWLVVISLFLYITQGAMQPFLYGFGLFQDIWASILQTVLYLSFSVIGGYKWGLNGILCGGILSYACIYMLWKPYFLYKKGFQKSVIGYWRKWSVNFLITCFSLFLSFKIYDYVVYQLMSAPYDSFVSLFFAAVIGLLICVLITFFSFYLLTTDMKNFVRRFLRNK